MVGSRQERERIDRHVMRNRIAVFDCGIMGDEEIGRLHLEDPQWRSPGERRWLAWGARDQSHNA